MDSLTLARRLRVAAIATTPLLLLAPLAWLNVINPMTGTFADAFEVVNDTDEPIEVTPVGYGFNIHRRTPLTQLPTGRLAFPVLRPIHHVRAHSAVTITYDGDDHRASDLIIEGRAGGPRWLALADYPTGSPFEQPTNDRWVIKSLSALPPATTELLEIRRSVARQGFWAFALLFGFLAPVLLWIASRRAGTSMVSGRRSARARRIGRE
jgi:hypothetical protein